MVGIIASICIMILVICILVFAVQVLGLALGFLLQALPFLAAIAIIVLVAMVLLGKITFKQ